jgi:hypothetical protein
MILFLSKYILRFFDDFYEKTLFLAIFYDIIFTFLPIFLQKIILFLTLDLLFLIHNESTVRK